MIDIVTSPDTDHSSWITLYTYFPKRRCVEIMKKFNVYFYLRKNDYEMLSAVARWSFTPPLPATQ